MLRTVGLGIGGLTALAAGIVAGNAAGNSRRQLEVKPERFSALAKTYDKEVGESEGPVGIDKIRANLIKKAHGSVLEVCAGTGRNNAYYDAAKVTNLILMDASLEMLEEALKKPFDIDENNVRVVQAENLTSFADSSFDTVVDTFGLCSVREPEAFIQDIERVLKPGGTILFLEHGRAESSGIFAKLINIWLDFRAPSHANYYGCLWNRQIAQLIENSTLQIVRKQVHHLGTCTEIEAASKKK